MIGRLRLATFDPGKGCFHKHQWFEPKACEQERRAMQAVARTGKPAGYTWRLWHDPDAGKPRPVATGPSVMLLPFWAREAFRSHEAWKRNLDPSDRSEAARLARIEAWLAGRDPWAAPRRARRRRKVA